MSHSTDFVPANPVFCMDYFGRNYDIKQNPQGDISVKVHFWKKVINVVPQNNIFISNLSAPSREIKSVDKFFPAERKKVLEAIRSAVTEDGSIPGKVFQVEYGKYPIVKDLCEQVSLLCYKVDKIWIFFNLTALLQE